MQINGTMVCALRSSMQTKDFFEACGRKHCVTLPNYTDEEFREVVEHYKDKEWIPGNLPPSINNSYIYHYSRKISRTTPAHTSMRCAKATQKTFSSIALRFE